MAGARRTHWPAATRSSIEDDHSGDIATGALVSVGACAARSEPCTSAATRRATGPTCASPRSGGAGDVVTAVANRRLLGPGWSSRILQAVLVEMLDDPATIATVAVGPSEYARRRQLVAGVLEARGVAVTGSDGINLWMTRRRRAIRARHPGRAGHRRRARRAVPGPRRAPHLRVTVGLIDADHERIAGQLAGAAGDSRSPRGHDEPAATGSSPSASRARRAADHVVEVAWLPLWQCQLALHDLWENEIPATMAEDHTSMMRFAAREPMGRIFVMEVRAEVGSERRSPSASASDPPKQDR